MFQRYLHPIINTTNHQHLQLPDNFVITSNSKIQVTVHDVLCLANYTYLNDIVINYILQAHHNEADRPDIYLLDSLFFTSLTHHPSLAINWTKNINIFTYNKIIIPICQSQHWILIVVSLPDRKIELYNSLLPRGLLSAENNILMCRIQKFLHTEYQRLYQKPLPFPFHQSFVQGIPQQTSSADCGLFILHFANSIMKRQNIQNKNYPHTINLRRQYTDFCISNLPHHLQKQIWTFLSLPSPTY